MKLHFFFVDARDHQAASAELNALLCSERVLHIQREWLNDGAHSGWAICVQTVSGPGPLPASLRSSEQGSRGKSAGLDYKQVLNEGDFACFAALREWRKKVAQAEGVPIYAVFSNEQLATVVTERMRTLQELASIEGVGGARLSKYGEALLGALQAYVQDTAQTRPAGGLDAA